MAGNPLQEIWQSLCARAWAEGRVIKAAPITFGLGVLLTAGVLSLGVWRIIDALYLERIATQQSTIEYLRDRLAGAASPHAQSNHGRHLAPAQRARMSINLQLAPDKKYAFQINSVPSCDECEQFADEARRFISVLPGWTASGAPLIFPGTHPTHGMWIISRPDQKDFEPVRKVRDAFNNAGFPLVPETEDFQRDTFVVLIGRQ